jgi:hypothetical protein
LVEFFKSIDNIALFYPQGTAYQPAILKMLKENVKDVYTKGYEAAGFSNSNQTDIKV